MRDTRSKTSVRYVLLPTPSNALEVVTTEKGPRVTYILLYLKFIILKVLGSNKRFCIL